MVRRSKKGVRTGVLSNVVLIQHKNQDGIHICKMNTVLITHINIFTVRVSSCNRLFRLIRLIGPAVFQES